MAHIDEHCNDCLRILGSDFRYVHEWIDEFFATMGPNHRSMRHHAKGVEEARKKWGDQAAKAAEIHILKDNYGHIPSLEQAQSWNLMI